MRESLMQFSALSCHVQAMRANLNTIFCVILHNFWVIVQSLTACTQGTDLITQLITQSFWVICQIPHGLYMRENLTQLSALSGKIVVLCVQVPHGLYMRDMITQPPTLVRSLLPPSLYWRYRLGYQMDNATTHFGQEPIASKSILKHIWRIDIIAMSGPVPGS